MKKKNHFFCFFSILFIMLILNFSVAFASIGHASRDTQCQSGGVGATSCSITYSAGGGGGGASGNASGNCEVNCGNGYYACCYLNGVLPFFHCICKSNTIVTD